MLAAQVLLEAVREGTSTERERVTESETHAGEQKRGNLLASGGSQLSVVEYLGSVYAQGTW